MTTKDFINSIKDAAISLRQKGGVLASVMIAQAICESASGTSGLTKASNNLFGIKGDYNGAFVMYPTKEWVNGVYVSVKAKFRKYASFAESIIDHDNFLRTVKLANGVLRYGSVLLAATPSVACQALHDCGYATSPTYAKTLTDIINSYNLTQYDAVAVPEAEPCLFTVKVVADTWIRKSPAGEKDHVALASDNLTLGITEVSGTWGRIQNQALWISINPDYAGVIRSDAAPTVVPPVVPKTIIRGNRYTINGTGTSGSDGTGTKVDKIATLAKCTKIMPGAKNTYGMCWTGGTWVDAWFPISALS